jgi:glycosyltransferase involved in cell wall biosynthesis
MAADPLVSVVVPVFNGERYLAEALASVRAQRYPAVELVVVDDGSSDGSATVAVGTPGVALVRQSNRGVAAARNAGVAASSGELLAFLDQDDRWTPDKLDVQVGRMRRRPSLAFTLAHQRLFLETDTVRPAWLRPEHLERPQIGYVPGTLVVWRTAFGRIGPFDEGAPIASDTDWFLRALDSGAAMEILPDVVLERRIHRANQSYSVGPMHGQLMRAVRRSIERKRAGGPRIAAAG